ncbi:unnamed protein product [Prunus brigantina]
MKSDEMCPVAMAMPNYVKSCFKLLVSLCKEIEKDIARYWWHSNKEQKGIHWLKLDGKLCSILSHYLRMFYMISIIMALIFWRRVVGEVLPRAGKELSKGARCLKPV